MNFRQYFFWYVKKSGIWFEITVIFSEKRYFTVQSRFTYLNNTGSHFRESKFMSIVREAFVTSVTCKPLLIPPVKFWEKNNNQSSVKFPNYPIKCTLNLTHINHESTFPNKHRFSITAFLTSGMLSISQRNFKALKYVDMDKPQIGFRNSVLFFRFEFTVNFRTISAFLTSNQTEKKKNTSSTCLGNADEWL